MSIMLKIKLKSLAQEARIIKAQESKMRGPHWGNSFALSRIRQHRLDCVRPEIRDTHIAYGYLRNRTLLQIEPSSKSEPNWDNVYRMVKKYGTSKSLLAFDSWRSKTQAIAA